MWSSRILRSLASIALIGALVGGGAPEANASPTATGSLHAFMHNYADNIYFTIRVALSGTYASSPAAAYVSCSTALQPNGARWVSQTRVSFGLMCDALGTGLPNPSSFSGAIDFSWVGGTNVFGCTLCAGTFHLAGVLNGSPSVDCSGAVEPGLYFFLAFGLMKGVHTEGGCTVS